MERFLITVMLTCVSLTSSGAALDINPSPATGRVLLSPKVKAGPVAKSMAIVKPLSAPSAQPTFTISWSVDMSRVIQRPLMFDLEQSSNLTSWTLLIRTNQSPVVVGKSSPLNNFRVGAHYE